MIREDKLYLAKTFYDYMDAIEKSQGMLDNTSEFLNAIIEGLNIHDGRGEEILSYKMNVSSLIQYAQSHNISHIELLELVEEYKTLTFVDYMEMKNKVTIADELKTLLKQPF